MLQLLKSLIFSAILFGMQVHAATRIKDIATVEGVRDNLLVGQGLVVGLNGTGDNLKNAVFTEKGLTDFLERLGINVQGSNIKTKNIAAVTVTATLPPFARMGSKINVKVSALGDSTSLEHGTLLATTLLGADGNVYAVAQGAISVASYNAVSNAVKTKSLSNKTNGHIQNGAIIEAEINFNFSSLEKVKFALYSPDFGTAINVAEVINNNIPGNTAIALDAGTVEVTVPNYRQEEMVEFIAEIEALDVQPDYKAKIVIDQSTGTVVIGDKVRIRPVAIAQGNLVVNVGHLELTDEQFGATSPEEKQEMVGKFVDARRGRAVRMLDEGATLSDLVSGLNKLGVYPNDVIQILYSMKSVGALDAVIEVK